MFKVGTEYKRKSEIHAEYGGQAQGGISTPKKASVIFVFTSNEGEQYGYKDEYRDDGIFWYTGEGQIGNMKMASGNSAILNHSQNKKVIYVFEHTRKGHVRYVGSAECLGFHKEIRPDKEGNDRDVFIFHLDIDSTPKTNQISEPVPRYNKSAPKILKNMSLEELRHEALFIGTKNASVKEKREEAYYRSQALKLYVIARSKGVCEGCETNAPFQTRRGPFLECHHLHRLADGGPDHPMNVVALCPNCHRRAHYAKDAVKFNNGLKEVAAKAEQIFS